MVKARKLTSRPATAALEAGEEATVRTSRTPALRMLSEDARARLILRSRLKARKLARSILRKWNARLDLNEVDSIVDLSLCEAAARFSPDMGASFMTFLYYHLRGNLIRTISASAQSNLVPLLDPEIMSVEEENELRCMFKGANAVDIAEALTGSEAIRPDDALIKREMMTLSQGAKAKLDTLAKQVLDRVFVEEEQLIDIANSLGYSRCHISRVKRRALETIYDDMSGSLDLEAHERPQFDDDTVSPRLKSRREIHRRKPRSKAAQVAGRKVVNG